MAPMLVRTIRTWLLMLGLILGLTSGLMPNAHAQAQVFLAEIVKIDRVESKVTLKAVMGHKTLRVQKPALLEGFKEGDQVLFETGQDGAEVVITVLSIARK